jgi:hypothetical protein
MRNVTISLTDDLARWARVWAAEHDTSLSAFLADMLKEARERETRYRSSEDRFAIREVLPLSGGVAYPSRKSLYDR